MRKFPNETFAQWEARLAREKAAADAFWNRPEEEISRDIGVPEEDLPIQHRGGYWRHFRSENVIDLVAYRRKVQAAKRAPGGHSPEAA